MRRSLCAEVADSFAPAYRQLRNTGYRLIVVPHFGHGKPRSPRHVATSVEVRAAIRDSRCDSRHSGVGLARRSRSSLRRSSLAPLYWSMRISQVVFAFSLHVSAGGRVLLFISGAAALILAVLCFRSLQQSILSAGHLDRRRIHLPGRGDRRIRDQRPDTSWPGVGDLHRRNQPGGRRGDAGIAVRIDRDADRRRRHLADRHRRLRGGLRLRYPQSGQGRRRCAGKADDARTRRTCRVGRKTRVQSPWCHRPNHYYNVS